MAILNEALLKLNLNKMKFYQKECLLNIESLNKNSNMYKKDEEDNTSNKNNKALIIVVILLVIVLIAIIKNALG